MVAVDGQYVAFTIGDDQNGAVTREIRGTLQEVDGGLEDGASPAGHLYPIDDIVYGDVPGTEARPTRQISLPEPISRSPGHPK